MADTNDAKTEILSRLSMEQVVGDYVALKRRGQRLWGLCPFHTEKTPSFTVNPDKDMFYCFGCQKGGDVFTFVMEVEKMDFLDALRLLAEKAGVEIKDSPGKGSAERDALLELNRRVAGTFHWVLSERDEAAEARDYLRKRGFTQEVVDQFNIGFSLPDPMWLGRFLSGKGYSDAFLEKSGLIRSGGQSLFRGRVMFPINNARGEVVGFGGRRLGEQGPKYVNSPETLVFQKRDSLFGLHQAARSIREGEHFILVEGYTDVMALHEAGFTAAVATLGTAMTAQHVDKLRRYAPRGLLILDADDAGQTAARRAIEILEEKGLEVGVVSLPEGSDPADFLQRFGKDELKKLLECPITGFTYLLDYARNLYDLNTPEGKEAVFGFLLPFLGKTPSQVKRDGYIVSLAESLNLDPDSIRGEYRRRSSDRTTARSLTPQARSVTMREMTAELFLVVAVAANLEWYETLRRELNPDDFCDDRAKELFLSLEECFRTEELTVSGLLSHLEQPELRQLILEGTASDEFLENADAVIEQSLRRMRREKLEGKRNQVLAQLTRYEIEAPEKTRSLLEEKMILDSEIEELQR